METKHSEWKLGHAIVYPTVDCAIFDGKPGFDGKIWLARKENERNWRFVGGFVDPSDNSLEEAAKREAEEETGAKCKVLSYISSFRIDDPRYKNFDDKIVTAFFCMTVDDKNAVPSAKDDIKELRLFRWEELSSEMFIEHHRELFEELVKFLLSYENDFAQ